MKSSPLWVPGTLKYMCAAFMQSWNYFGTSVCKGLFPHGCFYVEPCLRISMESDVAPRSSAQRSHSVLSNDNTLQHLVSVFKVVGFSPFSVSNLYMSTVFCTLFTNKTTAITMPIVHCCGSSTRNGILDLKVHYRVCLWEKKKSNW